MAKESGLGLDQAWGLLMSGLINRHPSEEAKSTLKRMDEISRHFLADPAHNRDTATSQLRDLLGKSHVDVNCSLHIYYLGLVPKL